MARIIQENDSIKVHYTGKLSNGTVFDSSLEREPLEFTLGQGTLIPGFEKGVLGMSVGDKKEVEIPYVEGYGARHEELIQEIPKGNLPKEITPEIGMGLMIGAPDGTERQIIVVEVKDQDILVDGNHPLAGNDLVFEIEILEINGSIG